MSEVTKMEPKWTPGPPFRAETSLQIFFGRPRARQGHFFAPGGLQKRPGADLIGLLEPTLGPHGATKRPRKLQQLIFDPPEALQGSFLTHFG